MVRVRVRVGIRVRDRVMVRVRLFSPLRHLHCAEYRKPKGCGGKLKDAATRCVLRPV